MMPATTRARILEMLEQRKPPIDIMLELADAIDALRSSAPADPWSPESFYAAPDTLLPDKPGPVDDNGTAQQRKIERLRAKIEAEDDPSELRALEAQLRLAREEHIHPTGALVPGVEPPEGGIIDIPPPRTKQLVIDRMQYASEHRFVDYLMNAEAVKAGNGASEWLAWFGKAGPKGLYMSDRLACLQMPIEDRRWLIDDMAQDDLAYAQNMGADLLKSEESMDREMARELLEPTWKS